MKADVFAADLARVKQALGNNHDADEREPKRKRKRTRRTPPPEKLQQADLLNVRRLLRACEDLDGLVSFDAFSDEIILERPIPRPLPGAETPAGPGISSPKLVARCGFLTAAVATARPCRVSACCRPGAAEHH